MSEFLSPSQSRQNQFVPRYIKSITVNNGDTLTQEQVDALNTEIATSHERGDTEAVDGNFPSNQQAAELIAERVNPDLEPVNPDLEP